MKTLLLSALSLSLLLGSKLPSAQAQEDAPKTVPMKQVPDPGRLEIEVNSDGKMKSFPHPAKALTEISRALSRAKRAKEGEEPAFEAKLTLNDQVFTFSDPESALEACKMLSAAVRDLARLRMGPGDLGEIPEVKPEEEPMANPMPTPKAGLSRAAAIAEVRRRIQAALQRQMLGTGTGGVSIRVLNPMMIQQTINQEVEKARQEGLLPANANAGNAGAGLAGDLREAKKESIVQMLAFTLGQADSVTAAAEDSDEPTEPKDPKEEPGEPKESKEEPGEPKESKEEPGESKPPETPKKGE